MANKHQSSTYKKIERKALKLGFRLDLQGKARSTFPQPRGHAVPRSPERKGDTRLRRWFKRQGINIMWVRWEVARLILAAFLKKRIVILSSQGPRLPSRCRAKLRVKKINKNAKKRLQLSESVIYCFRYERYETELVRRNVG